MLLHLSFMHYVLGSGPASISTAVALVDRGRRVTILDAGKTLEPDRQAVLGRLAGQEPEAWNPGDLETLRGGDQTTRKGQIHVKLTYGSDYPYRDLDRPLQEGDAGFHYSMARGGLSSVWGASLLPNRASDMAGWPIRLADLEPHYRAVLDFMPSTAVNDHLERLLPSYAGQRDPLRPSSQAARFLEDLGKRRERLGKVGISFGRSRMAVKASGDSRRHPCVYCGRCLYGCPYGLIYSTASTLDRLLESGKVIYIGGHVVERLEPGISGVKIHARDSASTEDVVFDAERVFSGCGILPNAYIALNSIEAYDTPLHMLDSQYFIYPFFRLHKSSAVETEPLHSLAQAYIEIDDPAISKHLVHLEIFSYSDFLKRALLETPLKYLLANKLLAEQMLGRLLVIQGFLHSDESAKIRIELRKPSQGRPLLRVQPEPNRRSLWKSIRVGLKLAANGFALGGLPVVPAIQFAEPGRSYHSGGTFPMSQTPGRFQTDLLGRLPGLDRIHFVDASIFPSIPATTITLTVMANAHRIAHQACDL